MQLKEHHIKPILFTTSKDFWFEKYFAEILATQRSSEGVIVDDYKVIYVDRKDLTPQTIIDEDGDHRFDWGWYEAEFTNKARAAGYNFVGFHFDESDRKRWGLDTGINGTYRRDSNPFYEFWICCDKDQKPRAYATTQYAEFVRLMLHEGGHGFTHFAGVREALIKKFKTREMGSRYELPAHYFDYHVKDIKQLYYHVSFKQWSQKMFIVELLQQVVHLLGIKVAQQTKPKLPARDMLKEWALAIQEFEGYMNPKQYPPYGTLSYRQNNPGNLRWSPFEDSNKNNFSVFSSYEKGFEALLHQLRIAATGESRVYTPTMTLQRFFEVYAPSSDNNYPAKYAAYVARRLGVTTGILIKDLI